MKNRIFAITALAGILAVGTASAAFAAGIEMEDAKKAALEAIGVTEDQVLFEKTEEDLDDGRQIFEIDFFIPGEVKYEFDIDAKTGTILEQDIELWEADDDVEYAALIEAGGLRTEKDAAAAGEITELQAKMLALKDAGLKVDEITFTKCKKDQDDGITKFEIELRTSDGTEYEYDIKATDGTILEKDVDIDD